jgi:hypothetical protein
MKNLLVTTPETRVEAKTVRKFVPNKLTGWLVEARSAGSFEKTAAVPDVTFVQLTDKTRHAELKAMIPRLARLQAKASGPSYVVFSFYMKTGTNVHPVGENQFDSVAKQINNELRVFPNPDRVNLFFNQGSFAIETVLRHIQAKLDLDVQLEVGVGRSPRPSPLDRVKEIVASTGDLRVQNGNLSAEVIAKAFGVSLSQLADWLGRSRQALSKTPDADAIQDELAFFERVARLRSVLPPDGFRKWLRIKNPELDDKTPLDLLATGEGQVAADLVDDMLTGAPA